MIAKTARKNLLAIARAYANATGTTIPAVSRKFYGKSGFLTDFSAGRQSITLSKMEEIIREFGKKWPNGLAWPDTAAISMGHPGKKIPVETIPGS